MEGIVNRFQKELLKTAGDLGIDHEVIRYGFKVELSFLVDCMISAVICALFHRFWYSVLFIWAFSYLRIYCGGYHCKTYLSCGLVYILTVTISCLAIAKLYFMSRLLIHFLIAVPLVLLVPAENQNNRIEAEDYENYRHEAVKRLFIILAADMIMSLLQKHEISAVIGSVLLSMLVFCGIQFVINQNERRKG